MKNTEEKVLYKNEGANSGSGEVSSTIQFNLSEIGSENGLSKVGFVKASESSGDFELFKLNIKNLTQKILSEFQNNEAENEKKKEALKAKLSEMKLLKKNKEEKIDEIKEREISSLINENVNLQEEIKNLKSNYSDFEHSNALNFSKLQFSFQFFAFILLSLFLFIFYMNATYSAFLKNIGAGLEAAENTSNLTYLFNSIFDVNTFEVLTSNLITFLFLISAPAVALSFGMIVHNLFEKNNKSMAIFLISAIFVYDGLLAYEIVAKIHEAKYLTGIVEDNWAFSKIFASVEFYLLLFSGFGSYLLWGLLFRLIAEGWNNSSPRRFQIQKNMNKIERNKLEIENLRAEYNNLKEEIRNTDIQINELEHKIETTYYVDIHKLEYSILSFVEGWARYIRYSSDNHEKLISMMSAFAEQELKSIGESVK